VKDATTNQYLLISGGTGYIGSHLLNTLKFSQTIILDRKIKADRLNFIPQAYIEKDIENLSRSDIPENLDLLIHGIYCKNIETEKKFLELVKEKNPNLEIIFFSSSAVYGDLFHQKKEKFKITDSVKPVNDYGLYKLELENFIIENFKKYKILRISNPYGKEFAVRGVYQLFKNRIYKSLETNHQASFIINYPQARTMIRDMIKIEDAIKQIITVIKSQQNGLFNISSGQARYLEDIAYLALKDFCQEENLDTSKFKLNFVYREKPAGEIIQSVLEPIPYELFLQDSYCN